MLFFGPVLSGVTTAISKKDNVILLKVFIVSNMKNTPTRTYRKTILKFHVQGNIK